MPYGIIKVDQVTFTNAGVDQTISVSGIVASISGNITATGTISGDVIRGGTLVSGATVTGTAGQFGTITGNTAGFTTVTGTTVTGTTATFTSGVFTNISGGTHTITSGVFASGTAANPSITFQGDVNTGIYSPGADQVAISTNGTNRFQIDSSGNITVDTNTFYVDAANNRVGVGTTSPSALLELSGTGTVLKANTATTTSTAIALQLGGLVTSSNSGCFIKSHVNLGSTLNSQLSFEVNGGALEAARFDSSGRLGIGTSSPQQDLHINDATGVSRIRLTGGAVGADNFEIGQAIPGVSNSGFSIYDVDATASRFVIDSSGNVGIGTTAPNEAVTIATSSAASYIQICDSSTGTTSGDGLFIGSFNGAAEIKTKENNVLAFGTNNTERARIDSSGRLLVGTSSARSNFYNSSASPQVQFEGIGFANAAISSIATGSLSYDSGSLILGKGRGATIGANTVVQNNDILGYISFQGNDGTEFVESGSIKIEVDGTPGANDMPGRLVFSTTADGASSPTERMRIDNAGNAFFSTTDLTLYSNTSGSGALIEAAGALQLARSGDSLIFVNRLTNDGDLIVFYQAGTSEGSISVSGTTVSYNGAHLSRWSQLPSGAERTEILRGTVLSNIDEMCEWDEEDNEQLNRMKVSDVEGDKNVAGVFQAWDDDDDTYTNDFYCAMTGDFIIRIDAGVTVERGDLLMSAGDGTAKPQDDDIIRSKTIAKVTSTNVSCTYEDGSYCVPCVLMAC